MTETMLINILGTVFLLIFASILIYSFYAYFKPIPLSLQESESITYRYVKLLRMRKNRASQQRNP